MELLGLTNYARAENIKTKCRLDRGVVGKVISVVTERCISHSSASFRILRTRLSYVRKINTRIILILK